MDTPHKDPENQTEGLKTLEPKRVRQILSVKMRSGTGHYEEIRLLGEGSFGEVRTARDTLLGREVAIKSIKERFREDDEVVNRFLREARGTAQLEHPNIMPVHELGSSHELGLYFSMKKINGETLKEILDKLHEHPAFYEKTYPLPKLLEVFLAVCNGVSFAHSRGVVHRDLKPANIMMGQFGETLVLDWGLVKDIDQNLPEAHLESVQLQMDDFDIGSKTLDGSVSGTPNYMPPEQADGRIQDIGIHSDVYSLGAILYHILAHRPAFERMPLNQLLKCVKEGQFTPPRKRFPELDIPRELEAICLKAMSKSPIARYKSVEKLAQDVRNYMGHFEVSAYKATRREKLWNRCRRNPIRASILATAMGVFLLAFAGQRVMLFGGYTLNVNRAETLRAEADQTRQKAQALFAQLEALQRATPLKQKSKKEVDIQRQLDALQQQTETRYGTALALYLGIPEPYRTRKKVVEGYRQIMQNRIETALLHHNYAQAQQWKDTIELHLKEIGAYSAKAQTLLTQIQKKINGDAALFIPICPAVEKILIWPLVDSGDQLKPADPIATGSLPLEIPCLKKGAYMLELTLKNGSKLPYPIFLSHGEEKHLELKIPTSIPAGMAYVPSGTFFFGGEDSRFYRLQQRTIPAFFIKSTEVTIAEYLQFWKTLPTPEQRDDCMPRIQYNHQHRCYQNAWDDQGHLLDSRLKMNFPIIGITHTAAEAFCQWKSQQTGTTIRLPSVFEWEKAARGVDGRRFVWGNGLNRAFALVKDNLKGKEKYPLLAPPEKFKFTDRSVYNAFDMAGNVREMTSTPFPDDPSKDSIFYQIKGASASTPSVFLPCAYASDTPVVPSDIGFRYIQEIHD